MSFSIKLFFTFVVFGIFLALFSVYSFSQAAYERQLSYKTKQANECIIRREAKISNYIKSLDHHLLAITNNKSFQSYVLDNKNKNNVLELFEMILLAVPGIQEIKYTSNNSNNNLSLTSKDFSYSKNRSEIIQQKLLNQKVNKIWHSEMNNSKSSFDIGINTGKGILQFQISLDEVVELLTDTQYNLLLINQEKTILIDSFNKFSGSLDNKANIQLKKILDENNLNFLENNSVITKRFISLKLKIENSEDNPVLVLLYPDFGTLINDETYHVYISILVSTIVLAIILAYIFSRPMARITYSIERLNNRLDRKVEQRTTKLKESLRVLDKYVIRTVTDTNGMLLKVSDAFCKVSQYSKEELVGQNQSIIRHPDMPDEFFTEMWKTIKTGKKWKGQIKNIAKDNSYYWVESYIEPNFVNKKIVSYTAIQTKISNKIKLQELNKSLEKRIKEEVAKNVEQLELIQKEQLKSVKLSSIGALAAGITHEINTPLTYIKGNFELMKYDVEDLPESTLKDRILEDTNTITDGLNRISNIVEAMKEVAQTSSESIENVNIYSTLITALTLSFNSSKLISKIYLNNELFDINSDKNKLVLNALVQKQRIEQLWMIILSNALDELVKIEDYGERRLNIEIKQVDDKIIVDFIDNAGGIKEDIIAKIFEPFVSNKERGGIGIGLNIAKKIVDDHSGKITAKNVDNGAQFRIELYTEGAMC